MNEERRDKSGLPGCLNIRRDYQCVRIYLQCIESEYLRGYCGRLGEASSRGAMPHHEYSICR